jgi:hypothetical protein
VLVDPAQFPKRVPAMEAGDAVAFDTASVRAVEAPRQLDAVTERFPEVNPARN